MRGGKSLRHEGTAPTFRPAALSSRLFVPVLSMNYPVRADILVFLRGKKKKIHVTARTQPTYEYK